MKCVPGVGGVDAQGHNCTSTGSPSRLPPAQDSHLCPDFQGRNTGILWCPGGTAHLSGAQPTHLPDLPTCRPSPALNV